MEELLEQGVGILMLTSDYTEALEMSHRIFVLYHSRICKEFQRGEATGARGKGLVWENPSKMLVEFCPAPKQDSLGVIKAVMKQPHLFID